MHIVDVVILAGWSYPGYKRSTKMLIPFVF